MLTPSINWDRRDSFTRPRQGAVLGSSVDISKNVDNTLDDYVKIQAEAKGYVTPFMPLTLAGVVRGGYVFPYGGTSIIPTDRQFDLGGTGDLRGFEENLFHPNSSEGTTMIFASVEARIDVGYNIELAAFTDIGRLENDFTSLSVDQFRSSAGLGIRYITPIGPIGLLYGWKLGKKEPNEKSGNLHFALGYTF
jgi:outer membrane protein insertion porin family